MDGHAFSVITARSPLHKRHMKAHGRCLGVSIPFSMLLAAAGPVHATPQLELSYAAPPECPAEAQFVTAVNGRGGRFDATDVDSGARKLSVTIRHDAGGFSGSLRVEDLRRGASAPREVHAANCGEVIDGLAVVTAIALGRDGQRATSATPGRGATIQEAQTKPPLPGHDAPSSTATNNEMTSPRAAEPPPEDRPFERIGPMAKEKVAVPAGELTFDNTFAMTATAGAVFGAVPSVVLPRFDFELARANFVTTPDTRHFLTGPVGRARWSFYGPGTYRSNEYATELLGMSASIGGCSSLIYYAKGPILMICGSIGAGAMSVQTKNGQGLTQSKTMGIASGELDADFRYNIGSLVHIAVTAGGGMWVSPITAERADGSELFHTSLFHGYAMAGAGIHF